MAGGSNAPHVNDGSENKVTESSLRPPKDAKNPDSNAAHVDQGLMPHATVSATKVAGDIAQGMKTVINEAIEWADRKAGDLSADKDEGAGPYGSPATCVPSDLDPIASGVLPAMEAGTPGKSKQGQGKQPNEHEEKESK